jgi:hypothetical protein
LVFLCDIKHESIAEVVWILNNTAEAFLNILAFTKEKRKTVKDLRKAQNGNQCPPKNEEKMAAITLLSELNV